MTWTALVPVKPPGAGKTRLRGALSDTARQALADDLFGRVMAALAGSAAIGTIVVLSTERPAGWTGQWIADTGRGLNPELTAAREALDAGPLIVIHADLPFVTTADIDALAAVDGRGIAPDRHGTGTNALALPAGDPLAFAFGIGSFARHRDQPGAPVAIVDRPGLAFDLDTPPDLAAALAGGFAVDEPGTPAAR